MSRPRRGQERFLDALRQGETVVAAANTTAVSGRTLYRWRKEDPEFAAAWDEAYEQGADALEHEAHRRAMDGSDTLLMFLLKAKRRQRFSDYSRHELTGAGGGPVEVLGRTDLSALTEEQLDRVIEALEQLRDRDDSQPGTLALLPPA